MPHGEHLNDQIQKPHATPTNHQTIQQALLCVKASAPMESISHMVAHSQTNPPLLLHPPLPTLNFQLSIRFPASHSYTFLLLTFTDLPSHFSTLFSSPFNLLSLHFSSHIVLLLHRFHSTSPLFSVQQQSAFSSIDAKCHLFHFSVLYLPLHLLFSTLNFHHFTFLFAILYPYNLKIPLSDVK